MAKIVPFRGLRYNAKNVADLYQVMAPPNDVISPDLQDRLYQRHPNNIVRLILGKILEGDDHGNSRYTRAAEAFLEWQKEDILTRDDAPSLYFYDQE